MMTLRIPRRVYGIAIECSDVPEQSGWPEPVQVKKGRGSSLIYTLPQDQHDHMIDHIQIIADSLEGSSDEDARQDRAVLRAFLRSIGRPQW